MEKVFCKDCANHHTGYYDDACVLDSDKLNPITGEIIKTVESCETKNKDLDCKDYVKKTPLLRSILSFFKGK